MHSKHNLPNVPSCLLMKLLQIAVFSLQNFCHMSAINPADFLYIQTPKRPVFIFPFPQTPMNSSLPPGVKRLTLLPVSHDDYQRISMISTRLSLCISFSFYIFFQKLKSKTIYPPPHFQSLLPENQTTPSSIWKDTILILIPASFLVSLFTSFALSARYLAVSLQLQSTHLNVHVIASPFLLLPPLHPFLSVSLVVPPFVPIQLVLLSHSHYPSLSLSLSVS